VVKSALRGSMAFTDSGLWIPHPLRKNSWRRFVTFSSVVSILSIIIASATFFTTRDTTQTAQRAYLSYSMRVKNPSALIQSINDHKKEMIIDYLITIQNLGNTPAIHVFHRLAASSMFPNIKVIFNQDFQSPWIDIAPKGAFSIDGYVWITNTSQTSLPLALFLQGSFSYDDIFSQQSLIERM
jgi:hypothetical protein